MLSAIEPRLEGSTRQLLLAQGVAVCITGSLFMAQHIKALLSLLI